MTPPFTLLKGGQVVLPTGIERRDLLLAGGRIVALAERLDQPVRSELLATHDLGGLTVAPGLVDAHVHFLGGGGGDGFETRLPELALTDLTANGITTVVGAPGIDMVSRNMEGLLAKARGLRAEGLSAFVYMGGFHRPLGSITGSVWRDSYLLADVIGVKLAVGEPRAPSISERELVDLARELAWVERATGRGAVLHIHLGLAEDGPALLQRAIPRFPSPARAVITHCNYAEQNLAAAIGLAPTGVLLDITTTLAPERGVPGAVSGADAVAALLRAGVGSRQISMSTDGNGHVPKEVDGSWEPYRTHMDSLLDDIRAVARTESLATALSLATANPADALRLPRKGRIAEGADADFIAIDDEVRLVEVYAGGRRFVHEGRPVVLGRAENRELREGGGPESGEVTPPER
jgi:beta-aspartyl-dipeptidase (metallo-type)